MGEFDDSVGSETTTRRPNSRYSMFSRKYLPRPLSRSRHRNTSRDRPSTAGGHVCSKPLPPQSGLFKFLAKRKVGVVVQIDGKQYNITVYTSSPASFVIEEALRRHGKDIPESIDDLEIIQASTQLPVSKTSIVNDYLSGGATFEIRRFRTRQESNQDEENDHHDECGNGKKHFSGGGGGPDSPTRVDNQHENNVQRSVPLKTSLQSKFPVRVWKNSQDPAKDAEQPECDFSKGPMKASLSYLSPDLLASTLSESANEGKEAYIEDEIVVFESAKGEVARGDTICGDSKELQFEIDVQKPVTVDEIPLCNSAITLADNVKKRNRRISHLRQLREDGISATPPSTPRGSATAVLLSTQPLGSLETEEGVDMLQRAAEELRESGIISDDKDDNKEGASSEAVDAPTPSVTGTDPKIWGSKARERKNTLKSHISLLHFSIHEVEKEILKAQKMGVGDDGESHNERSTDLTRLKVRLASLKQQLCALQTKKSKLDESQMESPRKKHSRRHSISSLSSLTSGRNNGLKEHKSEKYGLEKLMSPTFCAVSDEQKYNRRSSLRRSLSQTPGKAQILVNAVNSTIPSSRRIQRRSSFHCGRDSYVSYSDAPGVGTYNVCTLDRVRGGIFSSTDDKRDSWVGAAGSDSPGVGAYNLHRRPKVKGGAIGDSLRF